MIDATRQLRWYLGLTLLFLAVTPLLMFALLASDAEAPDGTATALLAGAPVNLIGAVFVVRSMTASDPAASTRLLKIGAGIVIAGDALLFGIHALTT